MTEIDSTFLTPVGRIVQGDVFQAQTKDAEGRPLVVKSGPNAGQPTERYYLGLAIAKTEQGFAELQNKIFAIARAGFPSLFNPQTGQCLNPDFAFKITDGDSQVPNKKGTKPCDREGFPGHWVIGLTNGFIPKCYNQGATSIITDPSQIKRGDYARIYGTIKANGSMSQPGIFLNHSMIELCGYGEAIVSGPQGKDVFGGSSAVLPAGASATPLAPAQSLAPPAQTLAPPVQQAPNMTVMPAAPLKPPMNITPNPAGIQPPPAPAPDFLIPPTNLQPPQPVNQMTAAANGMSYEQFKGQGWTDEQLKSQGYMV